MNTVFLNGEFMPAEQAKISPMDRGFLFGDGVYEVVPSYNGKYIGFAPHLARMFVGLDTIEINLGYSESELRDICDRLIAENSNDENGGNLGVYIQVSRGVEAKRYHAYTNTGKPTLFIHTFAIAPPPSVDAPKAYRVNMTQDLRWQRCDIKTTSLLGNVMHFQQGYANGFDETILFDHNDFVTEASSSNVFIVKDGVIKTPKLDNHKLAGITRLMLLDILRKHSDFKVEETDISRSELLAADEVWLTSATKQVGAVTEVAGTLINNGKIGPVWPQVQGLFSQYMFEE
ncbi:D-amino acid aminotransferase [Psychrosphaera ytuae]|uniref:Aminodeoxychorismate lyase n=1 Tax=Psychrosphaera ytuae TaxID=2820710 RepID=A0A975DE40_9GAMM|nr:D-amino acid aminotransferase [Psychrosphaera ytuae]QTH65004.1 D-amino acid aminotransferase [Psychrosphaera ytuae]